MSDNGPQAPPPRETDRWLEPGKVNVQVIYVLYLVAFAVGITSVIGVVLAYLNRGKGAPWVQTHYTWAIRTFWIALLFGLISALLMVFADRVFRVYRHRGLDRRALCRRPATRRSRGADQQSGKLDDLNRVAQKCVAVLRQRHGKTRA